MFAFVIDGVASAIEQAKKAGGDKLVWSAWAFALRAGDGNRTRAVSLGTIANSPSPSLTWRSTDLQVIASTPH